MYVLTGSLGYLDPPHTRPRVGLGALCESFSWLYKDEKQNKGNHKP